jgi:hypothetical protein
MKTETNGGIGICGVLFIVFLTLKLAGVIGCGLQHRYGCQ